MLVWLGGTTTAGTAVTSGAAAVVAVGVVASIGGDTPTPQANNGNAPAAAAAGGAPPPPDGGQRWQEKGKDPLTGPQRNSIQRIDNVIENHAKPHDFQGVRNELAGKPTGFDHVTEMRNSVTSLERSIKSLEGSLKNQGLSSSTRSEITDAVARAKNVLREMKDAFNHKVSFYEGTRSAGFPLENRCCTSFCNAQTRVEFLDSSRID